MNPIEILMNEHRLIERVLLSLTDFVQELGADDAAEKAELRRYVTFLRELADSFHHAKEEDILFTAMVEHGFPKTQGPIAVMLHEHEEGRVLVRALAAYAEQASPWSARDHAAIAAAARDFDALLRPHIQKEDHVLYPMAEARLSPAAMQAMAEAFQAFEAKSGRRAELFALGESLASA